MSAATAPKTAQGVPVLLEESHALPLVDVELVLLRGALGDPPGREGLTHLSARVMRRGPKGMRAEVFDERLDRLGATLGVSVSHEHVRISGTVLARNLEPYLELVGRMLATPAMRAEDFGRMRRRGVADIVAMRDHDRALASRAFRRLLFGAHPYGRPLGGTIESLESIRRADVIACHERLVRTGQLIVGVAGDVRREELMPLLDRVLAAIPGGASKRPSARAPKARRGRHVLVVDKPERTQTQLYVGALGMKMGDPDYHALLVSNTGFGGTFTSRLMKAVRSERGWSYGAGTKIGADRQRDAWTMWTHPAAEQLVDCLALELELLEKWVERGLTAAEVRRSKRFLVKGHAFEHETATKRLEPRLETLAYRLPPDWHASFVKRVRAVDRSRANEATRAHLSLDDLSIALVATADDALLTRLAALPGVRTVTTIEVDAV